MNISLINNQPLASCFKCNDFKGLKYYSGWQGGGLQRVKEATWLEMDGCTKLRHDAGFRHGQACFTIAHKGIPM